ncbi:phospholipase D-like domain-containing protein [Clostridium estertheticum]|uniref:hypothetical protein n=1 Tax=Clostridium estertheticum TaxID=238834 RepID=UPI0038501177
MAQSGIRIRILTGNYLNITQHEALYLVKEKLGDKVEDNKEEYAQVIHLYEPRGAKIEARY